MFRILSVFTLTLVLCSQLFAAEILVVDLQEVVEKSKAGLSAKNSLETQFKGQKEALEKEKAALDADQDEIKKQSSLLSKEALQERVMKFRQAELKLSDNFKKFQNEFSKANNSKMAQIFEKIESIIEKFAKEKGDVTILEKSKGSILYVNPSKDITQEVIARLNATGLGF